MSQHLVGSLRHQGPVDRACGEPAAYIVTGTAEHLVVCAKKRDVYAAAIPIAAQVPERAGVMQGIIRSAANDLFRDRAGRGDTLCVVCCGDSPCTRTQSFIQSRCGKGSGEFGGVDDDVSVSTAEPVVGLHHPEAVTEPSCQVVQRRGKAGDGLVGLV
jgi:hypothetical protein